MASADAPVLHFNALSSGFGVSQITPLTAVLPAGKHLVLSGPSGCGKSSLLKVICGLQPAQTGDFAWGEKVISEMNLRWWRQQFCYLPQQPVMGGATIKEALRLPWQISASTLPVPSDEKCIASLGQLGLHLSLDTETDSLSGGEKQRLAIARALLLERPLWLLDEPTSALDETGRNNLMELLSEYGATRVSISHDPAWVQSADQVYSMEANHG